MAWIDTMVVRDGKWVADTETIAVPGEPCVDTHDGYGYFKVKEGE